ncbi:MAG: hypothetical protein A3I01_12080 [Betaproteobacteria bacterium RIFCSPLOWO2_02_FULL_65_24]|nr:MAG: hypothetical protein A3I01_12080 [Betaproteobacteria bacterium RIFCSPLOWO2_02_FULL_65_24]
MNGFLARILICAAAAIAFLVVAGTAGAQAYPDKTVRFADLGGRASPSSPAELRAQVQAEIARWNRTIDARRIERQ